MDSKMAARLATAVVLAASLLTVSAQTFQRLGTCPTLGCLLPPDQSDFLPGQLFDLRVEVHAPVNGSERAHDGKPDEAFKVTISKKGSPPEDLATAFSIREPPLEKWSFQWYEDLFARDNNQPSVVNVASKAYRKLALNEPGTYNVTLTYYGGSKTTAQWTVRPLAETRKAKNVIFFIGDGMTTNMVSRGPTRSISMGSLCLTFSPGVDYCRSPPGTPEYQWKIPDSDADGRIPRPGPPDDPLD